MAVDRFELSEKLRWVQENVDLLAESSIEFLEALRDAQKLLTSEGPDGEQVLVVDELAEESAELLDDVAGRSPPAQGFGRAPELSCCRGSCKLCGAAGTSARQPARAPLTWPSFPHGRHIRPPRLPRPRPRIGTVTAARIGPGTGAGNVAAVRPAEARRCAVGAHSCAARGCHGRVIGRCCRRGISSCRR